MNKFIKIVAILSITLLLCSCRPSETVSYNLSKEADSFNCMRKITVYNARTDMIILEVEGNFALQNNSTNELEVVCKTSENTYKKNYIYLNDYVIYVVEDINGVYADPYHYSITFYTNLPNVSVNSEGIEYNIG